MQSELPTHPAEQSIAANLQSHQEGHTEVIDVDENCEDGNSDLSDRENEEDPEDVIEVSAANKPSVKSGIKVTACSKITRGSLLIPILYQFSPTVVDVLERHWKTNGCSVPVVGDRLKQAPPDPSPESRRFYDGDWAEVLDLARSLILSRVILDFAFPTSTDLAADSMECLLEAVATVRAKPSVHLDETFRTQSDPI
jgi:hypothetical protein